MCPNGVYFSPQSFPFLQKALGGGCLYHHSNARPETIVITTTMNPSCRVGRGRPRFDLHVAEPDADLIDLEKHVLEA